MELGNLREWKRANESTDLWGLARATGLLRVGRNHESLVDENIARAPQHLSDRSTRGARALGRPVSMYSSAVSDQLAGLTQAVRDAIPRQASLLSQHLRLVLNVKQQLLQHARSCKCGIVSDYSRSLSTLQTNLHGRTSVDLGHGQVMELGHLRPHGIRIRPF